MGNFLNSYFAFIYRRLFTLFLKPISISLCFLSWRFHIFVDFTFSHYFLSPQLPSLLCILSLFFTSPPLSSLLSFHVVASSLFLSSLTFFFLFEGFFLPYISFSFISFASTHFFHLSLKFSHPVYFFHSFSSFIHCFAFIYSRLSELLQSSRHIRCSKCGYYTPLVHNCRILSSAKQWYLVVQEPQRY